MEAESTLPGEGIVAVATRLNILLQNRLRPNDAVGVHPATVEIVNPRGNITAQASKWGEVSLDITDLADGSYVMRVTPDNTSTGKVDSTLAETANPPDRIYRSLDVSITVSKHGVSAASVTNSRDGAVKVTGPTALTVSLQPLWMKGKPAPRGSNPVSMIVVHHTGGPAIGPAINTALDSGIGPHYEIDVDGQVVKFVQESSAASHAGPSQWKNLAVSSGASKGVNAVSIGIEVVHKSGAFPDAQYDALLDLLEAILKANPGIARTEIVGHSDVLTTDSGDMLGDSRDDDPGPMFEWPKLEAQKLGLLPDGSRVLGVADYSGFFSLFPADAFRQGDSDATKVFSGKTLAMREKANPKLTTDPSYQALRKTNPIAEIQSDLRAIGYLLGSDNGTFGLATTKAVQRFQRHFFVNSRPHAGGTNGLVDRATAEMIKKVRP